VDFAARYRQALRFKSKDVEEPVDMAWHRPIAAASTALILDLPVKPNHLTWMSLWIGWGASVVYWFTAFDPVIPEPWGYPLAAFMLFISVIFDCMDGQLARAKGGGTRMGRILDGAVDAFVLLVFYVLMVFDSGQRFGSLWFWVCAFAGITSWIQILVYDKLKSLYLEFTLADPTSSDAAEDMDEVMAEWAEIKRTGSLVDKFLFGLYVHGQLKFSALFSGKGDDREKRKANTAEEIEAYRAAHRRTMRLVTNLGLGTHMLFIYLAVASMPLWEWSIVAANLIFAVLFNLMLVVGKSRAADFDTPIPT